MKKVQSRSGDMYAGFMAGRRQPANVEGIPAVVIQVHKREHAHEEKYAHLATEACQGGRNDECILNSAGLKVNGHRNARRTVQFKFGQVRSTLPPSPVNDCAVLQHWRGRPDVTPHTRGLFAKKKAASQASRCRVPAMSSQDGEQVNTLAGVQQRPTRPSSMNVACYNSSRSSWFLSPRASNSE
jgi:hypothetical protein